MSSPLVLEQVAPAPVAPAPRISRAEYERLANRARPDQRVREPALPVVRQREVDAFRAEWTGSQHDHRNSSRPSDRRGPAEDLLGNPHLGRVRLLGAISS